MLAACLSKRFEDLSIIFFGTPEFAVPSLLSLIGSGEEISLVVTQTDKRKGRRHEPAPPPVKIAASGAGLRVMQPAQLKDNSFLETVVTLKPEIIIVVAYGKILPKSVLKIPEHGCINVHASLLPKYRGAAPMAWAIIRGEKVTGVTTMLMDEGLDTGPILLQQATEISIKDTTGSLGQKLSEMGASLLNETVKGIREGSVRPIPQKGEGSYAPPLKKNDGLIDWSKSAVEIFNFVRGMHPWPGAYCHIHNERVNLLKTEAIDGEGTPEVLVKTGKDELVVGTGHGLLSIIELQPSGKRPMSASAFIQGRKLKEGMPLR